jgi:choloylglycine hydrolase
MKLIFDFSLILLCLCLLRCDSEANSPFQLAEEIETAFGTISQIDEYPLFSLTYTSDYAFDTYLLTGNVPNYAANISHAVDFSCTCFSAFGEESRLLGRNYDWSDKSAYFLVYTNPASGYASVSTVDLSFFDYNVAESPASNKNKEVVRLLPFFPFDGMNEKRVAIGMNAVPQARSSIDVNKVTIGELQVIRLVLDYASTTDEAIALIRQYNVRVAEPPIHYLIADSSGHSVIIEYVNGGMSVMHNQNDWQVTTNFVITGISIPDNAPCWRYKTAYETLQECGGNMSEEGAVNLLSDTSVSITRWSTVYNLKNSFLLVAMGRNYQTLHDFYLVD